MPSVCDGAEYEPKGSGNALRRSSPFGNSILCLPVSDAQPPILPLVPAVERSLLREVIYIRLSPVRLPRLAATRLPTLPSKLHAGLRPTLHRPSLVVH